MKKINMLIAILPGLFIVFALSFLGERLSHKGPLYDAFFVAFIGSIIVGNLIRKKSFLWMGTALCKDLLIPVGLLLYGTQVNFAEVIKLKPAIFVISLINAFLYFSVIYLCNRYLFKITNNKISFLSGGANSICGVAATAVYVPFADAKEDEVTGTLLAIVITGLIAVFSTAYVIPKLMGKFMGTLTNDQYSALAGTTLNQTGAVKLAAQLYNEKTVKVALAIKNFRTSLIIPSALFIMFLAQNWGGTAEKMSAELKKSAVRYGIFIALLFFGASLIFTFTGMHKYSKVIEPWFKVIFGMTLASVGLLCNIKKIFKKEIFLNILSSIIAWAIVAYVSVITIYLYVK